MGVTFYETQRNYGQFETTITSIMPFLNIQPCTDSTICS